MKTLHRTRGLGHDLTVTQEGNILTLWSEAGVRHTVIDLGALHLPGLEYARNTLLALAFCPHPRSMLLLGLGGGSIYHMLRYVCPQASIDVVEIDPAVVELARRFFQVGSAGNFHIHVEDAADHLAGSQRQYDIIIFDAYVGDRLPVQCTTRQFFESARDCLTPQGVLVLNWILGEPGTHRKSLEHLESILPYVWVLRGYRARNTLLFAIPRPFTRRALLANAERLERETPPMRAIARLAHYLQPA